MSLRGQFLCGVNRRAGKGTVRESEMRDMAKWGGVRRRNKKSL